jgi:LAS superfamily LD-carboxypeptidase LdcB
MAVDQYEGNGHKASADARGFSQATMESPVDEASFAPIQQWSYQIETPFLPVSEILEFAESDTALEQETWSANADQVAFREGVLAAHIALRSNGGKRQPVRDLPQSSLGKVAGTSKWMRSDAAGAVGRLFTDARQALTEAQKAGDADARRTRGLGATSGYRSPKRQFELWREYFPKYYAKTQAQRSQAIGGEHGPAARQIALKETAQWIAAPGFSNHNSGIAIDFAQIRIPSSPIRNTSGASDLARWRKTWFYSWLVANATNYGFQPYAKEPWHWEYKPAATERELDEFDATESAEESVDTLGYDAEGFDSSEVHALDEEAAHGSEGPFEAEALDESELDEYMNESELDQQASPFENGEFGPETEGALGEDAEETFDESLDEDRLLDASESETSETAEAPGGMLERVNAALRERLWSGAAALMISAGVKDEKRLTNTIFNGRHPELSGRPIRADEKSLASEWIAIRDRIVRPLLSARSTAATTGGTPAAPSGLLASTTQPTHANALALVKQLSATAGLPWQLSYNTLDHEGGVRLIGHRDGVMQTTDGARSDAVRRMGRDLLLMLLGRPRTDSSTDDLLRQAVLAAFPQSLAVQIACGIEELRHCVRQFAGYVALGHVAYNAGPGWVNYVITNGKFKKRPQGLTETQWEAACRAAAVKYHQSPTAVDVPQGLWQCDSHIGWFKAFFVRDRGTRLTLPAYQYLRQIPTQITSAPPGEACLNAPAMHRQRRSGGGGMVGGRSRVGVLDKLYDPSRLSADYYRLVKSELNPITDDGAPLRAAGLTITKA